MKLKKLLRDLINEAKGKPFDNLNKRQNKKVIKKAKKAPDVKKKGKGFEKGPVLPDNNKKGVDAQKWKTAVKKPK